MPPSAVAPRAEEGNCPGHHGGSVKTEVTTISNESKKRRRGGWCLSKPRVPSPEEQELPRRNAEDERAAMDSVYENVDVAVEEDGKRTKCRAKVIVAVMVVGLLTATIVDFACHDNVRNWLEASFDWIEENPTAGERAAANE